MQTIAIYGGTFCPIHWGHIRVAEAVEKHMQFEEFLFLPCKSQVLDKKMHLNVHERLELLNLALKPYPQFKIDLSEIVRETPSYMVDTLEEFRMTRGPLTSMTLIIGMDSFLQLPHWHRWEKLLKLAHLIVVERAEVSVVIPQEIQRLLDEHQVDDKNQLLTRPCGHIYRYCAGLFPISSTAIRALIRQGQSTRDLLPDVVRDYIDKHQLFL